MKRCGHRPRTAKTEDTVELLSIPICSCDCYQDDKGVIHTRYHRILPDTLIPYKQYTAATIQEYICDPDKEAQENISDNTPKNWRKEFKINKSEFNTFLSYVVENTESVKKDILSSLKVEDTHGIGTLFSEICGIHEYAQHYGLKRVFLACPGD
jgi:hypothetical protein